MANRNASGLMILAIAWFLSCSATVLAQGIGEDLYIGGFVSQGYLNTSENDYLIPRSVNGTAEFTDAAIFFTANPVDRLRIGIQFIARNFGTTGNGQVHVDWAYGDYRLRDELGFRAGRVKLPFGLYNEGRDVDMLRTGVFLPQSVYNERVRDLVLAYEGAGAYGSLCLGGGGDLDYHVFGGTLNVSESTESIWQANSKVAGDDTALLLGAANDVENGWEIGTTEVEFREDSNPEISFPWVWGGSLVWNTPLTGLRLGSTFLNGRVNYRSTFWYDVHITEPGHEDRYSLSSDVDITTRMDHELTFSAEYNHDDLMVAWELYHEKMEEDESSGWYIMSGYRFSNLFSLAGTYCESYNDSQDKDGTRFQEIGLPNYYAWLKDWTISTRFDLTDFWLLKFEYHFLNGVEQGVTHSVIEGVVDPLSKDWGMLTAKTTFAF
jgi:hypothetical protein